MLHMVTKCQVLNSHMALTVTRQAYASGDWANDNSNLQLVLPMAQVHCLLRPLAVSHESHVLHCLLKPLASHESHVMHLPVSKAYPGLGT